MGICLNPIQDDNAVGVGLLPVVTTVISSLASAGCKHFLMCKKKKIVEDTDDTAEAVLSDIPTLSKRDVVKSKMSQKTGSTLLLKTCKIYLKKGFVLWIIPSLVLSFSFVKRIDQSSARSLGSTAKPWF